MMNIFEKFQRYAVSWLAERDVNLGPVNTTEVSANIQMALIGVGVTMGDIFLHDQFTRDQVLNDNRSAFLDVTNLQELCH
jgi:hypothetical protein